MFTNASFFLVYINLKRTTCTSLLLGFTFYSTRGRCKNPVVTPDTDPGLIPDFQSVLSTCCLQSVPQCDNPLRVRIRVRIMQFA